ncbi:MAG: VCBS repeat-containing protein [Myxococcota bacterium]
MRSEQWGPPPVAGFCRAAGSAGDVNADGWADLIVGAQGWDGTATGEGRAYLYQGSATGLSPTEAWVADPTNQNNSSFGVSLSGAGDVNHDGYGDVVVGAAAWDGVGPDEGRAYLYLGNASGLASSPAWTADPTDQNGSQFGTSVGGAGDVNGDGHADMVISAKQWDGEAIDEGRVYLFLGSATGPSTVPSWWADPADQLGARFGRVVALTTGDVNGDGFGDVAISADRWDGQAVDEGRAYLFLGSPSGLSAAPVWTADPSDEAGAQFGDWVAGVGDVNGDGYADVAVGAPQADGQAVDEGRVYLYLGSPTGLSATPAWTADPTDQLDARFGVCVQGAGDVNGDGFGDVIIGAPSWDGAAPGEGRAFLYLGNAGGLSPDPAWMADPTDQSGASFGVALAGAGDVNGDGFDDVVVGASNASALDEGRVYLYLGSAAGLSTTPAWMVDPTNQATSGFGYALSSAGDVNGDGFGDVVIGANQWDEGTSGDHGRAYLYLGGDVSSTGLMRGQAQFQADGVTRIAVGGNADSTSVVLKGRVTQESFVGGPLRLEVEAQRLGTPFTGQGSVLSAAVPAGSVASVTLTGLTAGAAYRWRARVVYPVGTGRGRWVAFGGNSEAMPDFRVIPPIDADTDGSDGGTDGGVPLHLRVGCGCEQAPRAPFFLLVFFSVVVAAASATTRRPKRRRADPR